MVVWNRIMHPGKNRIGYGDDWVMRSEAEAALADLQAQLAAAEAENAKLRRAIERKGRR